MWLLERRNVFFCLINCQKRKYRWIDIEKPQKRFQCCFWFLKRTLRLSLDKIYSSLFSMFFGQDLIKMYSTTRYQCFSTVLRLMHTNMSKKVLRHNQSPRGQEYCLYILLMACQQNQQHPRWKPLLKISSIRKKLLLITNIFHLNFFYFPNHNLLGKHSRIKHAGTGRCNFHQV